MMMQRRVVPALVVEGKYDKIRLANIVDGVILVTNGFRIYHDKEQLSLIQHYANTTGIAILTDADAAGFQIRNFLKNKIKTGKVKHIYIPDLHGKERRKKCPSAEGLLGVEGVDNQILLAALERAGVFEDNAEAHPNDITPALLYEHGLFGTENCTVRRQALLSSLSLPAHLSVQGLCEVLNTMTSASDFQAFLQKHIPETEGVPE